MSSSKINPTLLRTWQAAVGEIATHNGPVEVVPFAEDGEALPRVRARLLEAHPNDGSLIVEKPTGVAQSDALCKGVAVEVYVITGSTRMKARSRVIDVGWFKLNQQVKVMAIRLEPMVGIASAQRRACFRLSTSGLSISAKFRHPAWPAAQKSIAAKVLDLSDRGLGLTLGIGSELAMKMKDQVYQVCVPLPGEAQPLQLDARLVRVIETAFQTVTMGFQFEFDNLNEQRRVEKVVQHFSVEQQRKQLRRMRGAG